MIQRCLQVLFIVLYYLGGPSAYSQNYAVDTASIREVITLWNEAHNEINEDSFNELYASTLLFYTNYLDKKVCIEKKLSLLNQGPFHQEIVSDLQLTFYEEGIVYCGFTKEVSTAKGKKSYPSYLLLKRLEDRYVITGESDLVTDRNLKFHLSLGPQIHISELSSVPLQKRPKFKSVYGVVALVLLLGAVGAVIYFFKRRSVRKAVNKEKVSSESSSTNEISPTNEKEGNKLLMFDWASQKKTAGIVLIVVILVWTQEYIPNINTPLRIFFLVLLLIAIIFLYLKVSDYNLLRTVTKWSRGTRTERRLVLRLLKSGIPAETIFHDLYLKKASGEFSQIDVVVTTQVGIIVFEVKDLSGWLYGGGNQTHWTQVLAFGKKKFRLYNPILQNSGHIAQLRKRLDSVEQNSFYSIVVLYGSCILKNTIDTPPHTFLIRPKKVIKVLKTILKDNPPINKGYSNEVIRVLHEAVINGGFRENQRQHIINVRNRYQ